MAATPPRRTRRRVDARGWLAGSRVSGFTAIMLGLVVLAAFVLVPTIGTYVSQRQQIAAMSHAVQLTETDIAQLKREQRQWKDPAYVIAQARSRLFFVKPGEVVYLIDDNLPPSATRHRGDAATRSVATTRTDWMSQLLRSVTTAGVARPTARTPSPGR